MGSYIRNVEWCPGSCPQRSLGETSDTGSMRPFLVEGSCRPGITRQLNEGAFQSLQRCSLGTSDLTQEGKLRTLRAHGEQPLNVTASRGAAGTCWRRFGWKLGNIVVKSRDFAQNYT